MFIILDYSSALEYSIIRRYTNIVYYYYYYYYYNDQTSIYAIIEIDMWKGMHPFVDFPPQKYR